MPKVKAVGGRRDSMGFHTMHTGQEEDIQGFHTIEDGELNQQPNIIEGSETKSSVDSPKNFDFN
jgi:hypothetical protein